MPTHILFLSLVFAPDGSSTAALITDLARDLQSLGNSVAVVTTTPHHTKDPEAQERYVLKPRWGRWVYEGEVDGVRVYHIRMRPKGTRTWGRIWDYALFHLVSLPVALRLVKSWEVIFAPSPPLSIGFVAWLLSAKKRTPFIYNVQEIHPDSLIELGIMRNKVLIWLTRRLELFVYHRAQRLAVISDLFRQNIAAKKIPNDKIVVIPNFVDTEWMTPQPRQNSFSAAHGLDHHFVILYSGNLGWSQDTLTLLKAAEALKQRDEVRFLIIGEGADRPQIEHYVSEHHLENVVLLPYQPRSLVPLIYGTADLCWIGLRPKMAYTHVPSKIYTIMAAGRPVLLAAEADSEPAVLIRDGNIGFRVEPEAAAGVVNAIQQAVDDRALTLELGSNSRTFVLQHYARTIVVRRYHDLFSITRRVETKG